MPRAKGTGGQAKELTKEEIRRIDLCLTGLAREHRNRALFYLGLGSGMRISEICQLKVGDLAQQNKQDQWQIADLVNLEKHSTKSKRSRIVYLSKQAQKFLKIYLDQRSRCFAESYLFPSVMKSGQSIQSNTAIKLLKSMFHRANVNHASSHSLRRTHANTLRRAGVDLKIIQEQLGHSSLATTERYFRVDPIEAQSAIQKLKF